MRVNLNEWKKIPGFPRYYINGFGQVLSSYKGAMRQLLTIHKGNRYAVATLQDSNKKMHRLSVHRLVLLTFVGPPPKDKPHCRHIDGNPLNNTLTNLMWGSAEENWNDRKRHGRFTMNGEANIKARLTRKQVEQIRAKLAAGVSQGELAAKYGVAKPTINHIHCGRTWMK